ncbi:MAG: hypothetical protein IJZ64_00770 [Ruminococcus sp.]|nr:hypothetical protein [Ruminococcus sp.]
MDSKIDSKENIFSISEDKEKETNINNDISENTEKNTEQEGVFVTTTKIKKQKSDDVFMTQCILCVVLVFSIFVIHWIDSDFQEKILSIYNTHLHAPAENVIMEFVEKIESWFKK